MFDLLGTPRYLQWHIKVHFSQFTGEWNIEGKSNDRANIKATNTYGTDRINAYKIIEQSLNLKDVRIFDYVEDADGKRVAILNKKETAIAQAKQEAIKQAFQEWIWEDPERRDRLTRLWLGLCAGLIMMMWLPALYAFALRFTRAAQLMGLLTAAALAVAAQLVTRKKPREKRWTDAFGEKTRRLRCCRSPCFGCKKHAGGTWER